MFQDVTTHVYDGTDVIMLPVKRQFERVELTPEVIGLCSSLLTVFYYLHQGGYDFGCLSVSRITPKLVDEFLLSFFFWGGEWDVYLATTSILVVIQNADHYVMQSSDYNAELGLLKRILTTAG